MGSVLWKRLDSERGVVEEEGWPGGIEKGIVTSPVFSCRQTWVQASKEGSLEWISMFVCILLTERGIS